MDVTITLTKEQLDSLVGILNVITEGANQAKASTDEIKAQSEAPADALAGLGEEINNARR